MSDPVLLLLSSVTGNSTTSQTLQLTWLEEASLLKLEIEGKNHGKTPSFTNAQSAPERTFIPMIIILSNFLHPNFSPEILLTVFWVESANFPDDFFATWLDFFSLCVGMISI